MKTRAAIALAVLASVSCRDTAEPTQVPAALGSPTPPTASAVAGQVMTAAPTFEVTTAAGVPIAGVSVTVTVAEGGGTLTGAPTRTLAGPTPVGRWTLGTRAGRNTLRVRAGSLAPFDLVVQGVAGTATSITAVSGNDQLGFAGTSLVQPLVLQVSDLFGNGVAGETIRLTVDSAGSSLAPTQLITDSAGRTLPATWRLGVRTRVTGGVARLGSNPAIGLPLRAEFRTDYQIEVRFLVEPSPEVRRIFQVAADRISGLLVGDVPDVALVAFNPSNCGGPATDLNERVDDLVIYAAVVPIDGVGRILGRAGPCFVRTTSRHTIIGSMQFDEADALNLITSGRFEAVVLHEMLHVVGIGSLWRSRGLLEGDGSTDPRVIGPRATSECLRIGFSSACGIGSVPAENTGGSGTFGSHWRESIFDAELMTGFAESTPNMPLSALTAAGLEDLGYVVNTDAVDVFAAPLSARFTFPRASDEEAQDVVLRPIGEISPAGWVRRFPR